MADEPEVRTLVGKKTLAVSLVCLRSLLAAVEEPVRLVVHEDGTLDDADRESLRALGPGVSTLPREGADGPVREALARHPVCRGQWESNIMFRKMFDTALLAGARLAYCDSDILFVRRVGGLFAPPAPSARLTFMTDARHAYSLRPWQVAPLGPVRLVGRANAGLIVWERPELDFDFLEWLLGRLGGSRGFVSRGVWAEQTAWAALAARTETWLWDPRQVVMADAAMSGAGPEAAAIHFVSTYRNHLPAYAARPLDPGPPARVGARRARRLTPAGMLWSDARARLL